MLHDKQAPQEPPKDRHLSKNGSDPRGLPKKGGSGGAHNWGSFQDDVDYVMDHPNARSIAKDHLPPAAVQLVNEKTFCKLTGKPIPNPVQVPHFDTPTVVKAHKKRHRRRRHPAAAAPAADAAAAVDADQVVDDHSGDDHSDDHDDNDDHDDTEEHIPAADTAVSAH